MSCLSDRICFSPFDIVTGHSEGSCVVGSLRVRPQFTFPGVLLPHRMVCCAVSFPDGWWLPSVESVAPGAGVYSVTLSSSLSAWEQLFSCGKHVEKAMLESVTVFRGGLGPLCSVCPGL